MSVDSSSNLCEKCKVIEFDDSAFGYQAKDGDYLDFDLEYGFFLDYELEDSTPDMPRLSSSARQGCDFCSLLVTAICESGFLGPKFNLRLQIRANDETIVGENPGIRALVAHIKAIRDGEDESEAFLMFTIDSTPGEIEIQDTKYTLLDWLIEIMFIIGFVRNWLRLQFSPDSAAICPQNLQRIRYSLEESYSRQSESNGMPSDGYLPSRLIDVEPQNGSECRLVTIGKKPNSFRPHYAALSYCWGNPEDAKTQFKTTRDTIDSRTSGFTINMTSPAIRDAIEVTRALGIRYLWTDALCIVQDDKEDWERESGEMASIYQHTYLTICAAASESCREGFLERLVQSIQVNFESIINPHVRGIYTLCWYGTIKQPHFADFDYEDSDVDRCHWNTRGWTFQEMKLSQRLLIFGRRKLHFWSKPLSWIENETTDSEPYTPISYNSMDIHNFDQSFLSGWLYLIDFYTKRALTNHLDRLPAISGIASLASGGHPEHYLAGIREGEMYRDLMWVSGDILYWKRDKMPKAPLLHLLQSPDPYIAPSWSWASHFGAIATITNTGRYMFGSKTLGNFAKGYGKLEAWTQKSGLNPYGQISDGALEYSGFVMALSKPLGPARRERWNMREYHDTDYSILIWLDWHPDGDDEPADDLSCILLGTCQPLGEENDQWKYEPMLESHSGSETDDQYPRVTTNPDYDSDGQALHLSDEEGYDGDEEWYDDSSSEGSRKTLGSSQAKQDTLHDDQYHGLVSESSTEEEEEEDDEDEEEEERVAFGLMIHPAGETGKFFRVGIWTSVRRGQNYSAILDAFRSRPSTSIELI